VEIFRTNPKNKRLRISLWVLLPVLIAGIIISVINEENPTVISLGLIVLALIDICLIYIFSDKYYNWPFISVMVFLVGMIFKSQHWPLSGTLLTISIVFLCMTTLVNAVRLQVTMKGNPFLKWFGSISCIIIATYMFGLLLIVQHWSKKVGDVLGYIGISLFILSILGMVFTLPRSDYLNWKKVERKIFYRSVLAPMVIVFNLILITLVFSNVYIQIMNREQGPSLGLKSKIELHDLEGLVK
jgi:hypothetical protein